MSEIMPIRPRTSTAEMGILKIVTVSCSEADIEAVFNVVLRKTHLMRSSDRLTMETFMKKHHAETGHKDFDFQIEGKDRVYEWQISK